MIGEKHELKVEGLYTPISVCQLRIKLIVRNKQRFDKRRFSVWTLDSVRACYFLHLAEKTRFRLVSFGYSYYNEPCLMDTCFVTLARFAVLQFDSSLWASLRWIRSLVCTRLISFMRYGGIPVVHTVQRGRYFSYKDCGALRMLDGLPPLHHLQIRTLHLFVTVYTWIAHRNFER